MQFAIHLLTLRGNNDRSLVPVSHAHLVLYTKFTQILFIKFRFIYHVIKDVQLGMLFLEL